MTEHPTHEGRSRHQRRGRRLLAVWRMTKESIPRIEQLVVTIRLQLDYPRPDTYIKALEALDELATLARARPE